MSDPQISLGVDGRPGPDLPGPFAVGRYAGKLKEWMRERPRVLLIGEVTGVGRSKVQAYFELRDGDGAVPCAIWKTDLEKAGLPDGALRDGAEVVIAGGLDYYPGGGAASPNFCFRATHVRLAGEGDLLIVGQRLAAEDHDGIAVDRALDGIAIGRRQGPRQVDAGNLGDKSGMGRLDGDAHISFLRL